MKLLRNSIQIIVLMICVLIYSCTKPGIGGKSSIEATVIHESTPISFATVYIKYDANEFPGNDVGLYDNQQLSDLGGRVLFDSLRKGDYYLYAIGYDSLSKEAVFGEGYIAVSKPKELFELTIQVYD